MSELDSDIVIVDSEDAKISNKYEDELKLLFKSAQNPLRDYRSLSKAEKNILTTINSCFLNWNNPWKETYLNANREFELVYELMEALIHYEYQITNSVIALSADRTKAIAQAVARLVDYGNALLSIDLIVRNNDEYSSELDPLNVTTLQLFHSHVKAHNLREKLLYDYFKKDKPNSLLQVDDTSSDMLQVPSPKFERSHRTSLGSDTSINTILDGRKSPQQTLYSQIEQKSNTLELGENLNQLEISHMVATIRGNAFSSNHSSTTRISLLPKILSKIESLLTIPSTTDKMTNCFELLDTLLNAIEKISCESRTKEVNMIASALLKSLVRKVYIDERDNLIEFQNSHWTTCLLSMIRLMTAIDFNAYLASYTNLADLGSFLKDYLFVVKQILSTNKHSSTFNDPDINSRKPTYPSYWIEMILLSSSILLTSLTYLFQTLKQYFATNLQIWLSFMDCLLHFILQDTLKSNRMMLKERQRLLADDLRQTAAEYVWITWDSLTNDNKQRLLDDLTEQLLKACIVLVSKQRSILLPIFYDMMRSDFTSQYILPRSMICDSSSSTLRNRRDYVQNVYSGLDELNTNYPAEAQESLPYLQSREDSADGTVLTKFTHLIVGKLYILMIELELGDNYFKDEFCAAISGDLNPKYYNRASSSDTRQFKSMARHTSSLLSEFMQICLDLRESTRLSYKHLYQLCLFKLILFFKDKVDRIELYLQNLYKLCYLHHVAGRYVEAGFTLLEQAKTLPWSDKPIENHHRITTRFFGSSQALTDYSSLKMFLNTLILEYFEQGHLWEAAIPICQELIEVYKYTTYEYGKLAQMLEKMSTYYYNIISSNGRSNPEYFRVTFYGSGFPTSIENITIVCRGKPFEKLGDFQSTILAKYPDAKILNTLAPPDRSILDDREAKYLQINACFPVVNLKAKFSSALPKIEESILDYYRYNNCDKFTFSRRIKKPDGYSGETVSNEDTFANMWREQTTLTTNTLPGMLSFFPVYLMETSIVTPIESAIEDLERTNDRLSCMVNRFRADKRQAEDVRSLGQLLLGIVDAAVNGGIAKYEEAFFTSKPESQVTRPTSTNSSNAHKLESNFESLNVSSSDGLPIVHNDNKQPYENKCRSTLIDLSVTDAKHEVSLSSRKEEFNSTQIDKLKCLIAQQLPLLDEAIRLHSARVAEVMRPQHEHLESSYKKLKYHIMTKYYRYLPSDYNRSTTRSFRSIARSPCRSMRSESKLPNITISPSILGLSGGLGRLGSRRMLECCSSKPMGSPNTSNLTNTPTFSNSNIPYKQLQSVRRSLPFLHDGFSSPSTPSTPPHDESPPQEEKSPTTDFPALPIPAVRTSLEI